MRRRLAFAVISLLLAGLLLRNGQHALAVGPVQPILVGATTLSNITINGVPGTELVVAPGATITVAANWADNNVGCPACIDFVPAAFAGALVPAGCIENIGANSVSGSGTVTVGTAPLIPGTYFIVAQFEEQLSCGPGWIPLGGTVIAQIDVGAPNTGNFPATNFSPPPFSGANFDPRCTFGCGPGGLP